MTSKQSNPLAKRKLDQTDNGIIKSKSPDLKKMVSVSMSPKTTVYFKPGKDLNRNIENWKYNHRNCVY